MNKYHKYRDSFLLAEDDGMGGGGAGDDGSGGAGVGDSSGSGSPAVATIDPKALASEFGNVIAQQFKQQQQQEPSKPKVYTPEEIAQARKALNFWEPDDSFIQEFGNLETQKVAFTKLRDGLMNQFVAIQKAMLEQHDKQWQERFQPVQSLLEQRQQQEQVARFESAYPSLANPALADLREAVGTKLAASGAFNGKSESEAFDILAAKMAEVIKVTSPDFSLERQSGGGSSSPARRTNNTITPQAHGSGGGGAGGGGDAGGGGRKVPKAVSFFPKIRG